MSWTGGPHLAAMRKERSLTQDDLAERSGIGRFVIANIESGRKADLSVGQLAALASALGVNASDIDRRVASKADSKLRQVRLDLISLAAGAA